MTDTFTITRIDAPGEAPRYQAKDGRLARIICVDAPGDYPVVAIIGAHSLRYTKNGQYRIGKDDEWDLTPIPAPEPEKHTFYVNAYDGWFGGPYSTKEETDKAASKDRLYCVKAIEVERYV